MDRFDEAYEAATARGEEMMRMQPHAIAARYDRRLRRVVVRFSTGVDLTFAGRDVQGLEGATPEELSDLELSPLGQSLHFPRLDVDIHLPSLMAGITGSRAWMEARAAAAPRRAAGR